MHTHVRPGNEAEYLQKKHQEYLDSLMFEPYLEERKIEVEPGDNSGVSLGNWGLIVDCKILVEAEGITENDILLEVREGNRLIGITDYRSHPNPAKDKAAYDLFSRQTSKGLTLEEVKALSFILAPGIPVAIQFHNTTSNKATLKISLQGRAPMDPQPEKMPSDEEWTAEDEEVAQLADQCARLAGITTTEYLKMMLEGNLAVLKSGVFPTRR